MRIFLCLLLSLLLSLPLSAQEKKERKPGDDMIEKYLAAETDKLSQKFLDGAKTIDEWKQKRPRLYQEYMDMLGLWPLPEKTPLKVAKTGEIEAHGVVVEKVHFQSKPGLYVTANVYRALNKEKKKLPAIVYVCGHSGRGRDGNKTAFQDHGFWFANNGYVCIILDTLQLGEIPGVHHGTYGRIPPRWWWHSIGYSPAAVECWNGVRAIDYLCTRPDVDPARIGVTGISGGGAATFWIAAADERVKVAVPVSGMADLESYVKNKVINGHCDCMFLYNTYQWDWTTIAAMVAPRPMLFANSDKDPIFPMDANRRIMEKLRKLYGMYDTPNAQGRKALGLDEYVSPGGHAYRPDLRIAIFRFFNVHLKGDKTSKVEDSAKYTPLKGRELRVFPTDDDLPKDAINGRIDETFIPAAKVVLPEKGKFAEWKSEVMNRLKNLSFRPFPEEIPPAALPTITHIEMKGGRNTTLVCFFVEKGVFKDVTDFRLFAKDYRARDDASTVIFPRFFPAPKFRMFDGDFDLKTFDINPDVYGWTKISPPNYVERSHALLGHSIDQRKVFYLLSFIKRINQDQNLQKGTLFIEKGKNLDWKLVGKGQTGILAAYAALFEPSIKEVVVIDPPKSHKEGPHFLNVLRVLDIPEALGLLAPTPLTIIGGLDPAFDRTAEIYRLAGAADKLKRK
jgi:dienelactone hydrolase